mmetsp:Transcript_6148/g.10419  ORF Transcript_6148/g.10419 Transcript_6148/m.10419 type:complete len:137 (-) Transcript_6148:1323-1733(-)
MHEYKKAQHKQRKDSISSAETEDSSTSSRVTKTRNVLDAKPSSLLNNYRGSCRRSNHLVHYPVFDRHSSLRSSSNETSLENVSGGGTYFRFVSRNYLLAIGRTAIASAFCISSELCFQPSRYRRQRIVDMWNAFDD